MRSYKTRLDSIEKRIPRDMKVVCCFSREGDERIYSDSACTIPIEREDEDATHQINVRFHSVDGSTRRPVHYIIDDV